MPPHARPLTPSAESSATSTPAGDPLIIRMEGLPPERPKAYAFLQRRKAREIPPPSAPTQSSSSAVAQDATSVVPTMAKASAAQSQPASVAPKSQSRAAFLRKTHTTATPSKSTTVARSPESMDVSPPQRSMAMAPPPESIAMAPPPRSVVAAPPLEPTNVSSSEDNQESISEEEIPRPPRAPYGTREHAQQMRDDLLSLYEVLKNQWDVLRAMLDELDDFLDEDKSSVE